MLVVEVFRYQPYGETKLTTKITQITLLFREINIAKDYQSIKIDKLNKN